MHSIKISADQDHPEMDEEDDDGKDGEAHSRSQSEGGNDSSEDDSAGDSMEEEDYDEASKRVLKAGDRFVGKEAKSKSDAAKLRKEKRLAMNRSSARARRKKKKVLSESLAKQVSELTKRNQTAQLTNKSLQQKVDHLDSALAQAQTMIASLVATAGDGAGEALRRQRQGGFNQQTSVNPSHDQESLRALLQAAPPYANASNSHTGGKWGSSLLSAASTQSAGVLGGLQSGQNDVGLLKAHLLAQGQGQTRSHELLEAAALGAQRQTTCSQLLEAAVLGVRRQQSKQLGGSVTSPMGSFLGQSRVSVDDLHVSKWLFLSKCF